MPRLGDLLVQAGVVTPDEVEDAARAQVAYGARIGTNLVELDYLEIDELAAALGRQHRLPPATRPHFEKADAALQALLPAEIAARYGVVPLKRMVAARRIAIASLGPLSPEAIAAVSGAFDCHPSDLVVAVAAELRILYNLERVYGIARPSRYLRTRRGGTAEFAIAPLPKSDSGEDERAVPPPAEPAADADKADAVAVPEEAEDEPTKPISEDELVLEIEADEPGPDEQPVEEPAANERERRRFVRTVADSEPPATHPTDTGPASLGRINLRKLAVAAAAERAGGVSSLLRAIRRCRDREEIGALAIACLDRGGAEAVDAGALFIARGAVAVAWRGFARGAEVDFDQLAVPLDQPSVVAREPGAVIRRLDAEHVATPLDERLIAALGFELPTFVVAAPIAIRDHVIGFVYAHGRGDALDVERLVIEIADATRAALTSLLRAAQR